MSVNSYQNYIGNQEVNKYLATRSLFAQFNTTDSSITCPFLNSESGELSGLCVHLKRMFFIDFFLLLILPLSIFFRLNVNTLQFPKFKDIFWKQSKIHHCVVKPICWRIKRVLKNVQALSSKHLCWSFVVKCSLSTYFLCTSTGLFNQEEQGSEVSIQVFDTSDNFCETRAYFYFMISSFDEEFLRSPASEAT